MKSNKKMVFYVDSRLNGFKELGNGLWCVFREKMLGYFDEKNLRIIDNLDRLKRNNV